MTVHVPLARCRALLTPALVDRHDRADRRAMARFGVARPRLALAGLNPHAGEDGVIGDEDDRVLAPAVQRARARGVDIGGPIPATRCSCARRAASSTA